MNIVNEKVYHKRYGVGVVVSHEGNKITVDFRKKTADFIFPNAFEKFLTAQDVDLHEQILELYKALKHEKEIEKQRKFSGLADTERKNSSPEERRRRPVSTARQRRDHRSNIAFKCTYCDGGASNHGVGFRGVCSDPVVEHNVKKAKRVWCSNEDSFCRQYLEGYLTREELDGKFLNGESTCYENRMLIDWRACAGWYHSGHRQGQPMRLKQVQTDSLCVLTTRCPNQPEETRFIFAVFLVDYFDEGNGLEEGFVSAHPQFRIELTPNEAKEMPFWEYHANDSDPERPFWGSGLHRYFNDAMAVQILQDLVEIKKGTADEELAVAFLTHYASVHCIDTDSVPSKRGALLLKKSGNVGKNA